MNRSIALIFAVCTLFLAGCCTPHHATAWEYEIVSGNISNSFLIPPKTKPLTLEEKLNQAAADGWQVVSTGTENNTPFVILRRPKSKD